MLFNLAIRGDLRAAMARQSRAAEIAVSSVIKAKGRAVHKGVRREVAKGGFGRRTSGAALKDTVKLKHYPAKGRSINQAARIESKATYARKAGIRQQPIDLIALFAQGARVSAAGGRFLAIPTENAPERRANGRRETPDETRTRTGIFRVKAGLYAIYQKDAHRPGEQPVVMWWLVPNVTVRKRIDPYRVAPRLMRNAPELIGRRFERESAKAAKRAATRRR